MNSIQKSPACVYNIIDKHGEEILGVRVNKAAYRRTMRCALTWSFVSSKHIGRSWSDVKHANAGLGP